jgi:predicted metal-dependent hydrolase
MPAVKGYGTGAAHVRAQALLTEIQGVGAQYGVHSRDRAYLQDLVSRRQIFLSDKQRRWLERLEHRVFVRGVAS